MAMAIANNEDYNTHGDNLETFALLWLDTAVHTSEENRQAQKTLRATINHLSTFEDANRCQQYIRSVSLYDRLSLLLAVD
jgi:hypothetical protein